MENDVPNEGLSERSPASNDSGLEKLSWLLDRSIRLPGGFRIGLDGFIGLIPGVGDAVGGVLACWILLQALRQGAPKMLLCRMFFNIVIDMLVGAIPILGDVFDFFWMANDRNVKLLQQFRSRQQGAHALENLTETGTHADKTRRGQTRIVFFLLFGAVCLLGLVVVIIFGLMHPGQ